MRSKTLIIPAVLLAASAGISLWMLAGDSSPSVPGDRITAVSAGPAGLAPAALPPISTAGWRVGSTYVHDVDFQMTLTGKSLVGGQVTFGGRWKTRVLRASADLRDLEVSFEPQPRATAPGTPAADQRALLSELRQTFVARYDSRGRARQLVFGRTPSLEAARLLRELVTTFQVSLPERPADLAWSALELDLGGEVDVDYRRTAADRIARSKLRYQRIASPAGLVAPGPRDMVPQITHSQGEYELDADGRIAGARVRYAAKTKGAADVQYDVQIDTTFRLVSREHVSAEAVVTVDPRPTALTMSEADFAEARRAALRNAVKGKTVKDLMGDLRAARTSNDGEKAATARFQLSSLMQLDDQAVRAVSAEIRAGTHDPGVFSALGGAGTPAAQSALLAAATQRSLVPDDRLQAVHAIHAITEPTAETIAAVESLKAGDADPQIKKDASFALGSMIRQLGEKDPGSARAKVARLAAEWDPAAPAAEKRRVLRSLGNTASPDALATLKLGLEDPDPTVRNAAVRSLRNIPVAEVDRILSAVIVSGDVDDVRIGALAATSGRPYPALAGAFEQVLRKDGNATLRARTLQTVVEFLRAQPDSAPIVALVQWSAQNDEDPQIREGARQALGEAQELASLQGS